MQHATAATGEEAEVRAFLSSPGALAGDRIDVYETHCALVFVGAHEALKIKRRVRYPYLDFSTLEHRRAACERELEVNRPAAPDIYLSTVAITREADGRLALDGDGRAVEWAVRMRRFDQADILSERVSRGALPAALVKDLADMVVRDHALAPTRHGVDSGATLTTVADQIADELHRFPEIVAPQQVGHWRAVAQGHLDRVAALLARRSAAGRVRRCHGDLHLANIVLWKGRPVAFDAIEFDDRLASIDTLYDLAFLLMDLDRRGHRPDANLVLSRYLWRTQDPLDIEALAALPLMMSLRAGIRAMVTAARTALEQDVGKRKSDTERARRSFVLAASYLEPARPRLVAVAGLSGTGKSTLAAALAPLLDPAPGAIHLRSDLERKAMFGVEESVPLPPETYTRESSQRVYAHLMQRASLALAAGWPVIIDAVSLMETERAALADLARRHGAGFLGLWLDAPLPVLAARVGARSGDASDATPSVVAAQAECQAEPDPDWIRIDASGPPESTLAQVRARL